MAEQKLFLRRATGLVREIGLTTGIIIILSHVVGVGWQLRVFQAGGWTPVGTDKYFLGLPPIVMSFIIGGLGILAFSYANSVLTTAMPRSGGGYVAVTRILGPGIGFVAAALMWLSTSAAWGQIGVFCAEAFPIFAPVTGINLPDLLLEPWPITIVGAVIVVIFGVIGAMGVRQWGRFLHAIFWTPAAILVLLLIVFLVSSESSMAAGVEAIYGHTPLEYTEQALATGLDTAAAGNTYWGAVAAGMTAAMWAFGGWMATTFVAGEVREATRSVPKILFGSNIIIVVLYIIVALLLARVGNLVGRVGDLNFLHAVSYLNFGGGDFGALTSIGPWMSNFAAIGAIGLFAGFLGKLVAGLILVFAFLWAANDIPPFILVTSRTIFAMSFDRLLPEKLGDIHEDYHSPVNAIILSGVVAVVLGCLSESNALATAPAFIANWLNPKVMVASQTIWDMLYQTSVLVALIMFPLKLPQLFDRAPWRHSKKVTQVMGGVGLLFAIYCLYAYLFAPSGWDLLGIESINDAAGLILGGIWIPVFIGIYLYYKNRAKTTGVDLTTIFADIPPE